jgi:hypothetical protein
MFLAMFMKFNSIGISYLIAMKEPWFDSILVGWVHKFLDKV